jgi:hypothetical protein
VNLCAFTQSPLNGRNYFYEIVLIHVHDVPLDSVVVYNSMLSVNVGVDGRKVKLGLVTSRGGQ